MDSGEPCVGFAACNFFATAIHRFAVENDAVRECLASYVADHRAQRLACLGAFYADAAPIALRLDWTGSAELERLGIAADMLAAGMPKQGISSLLSVVRDNLDHLNTIRARLFGAKTPATADREL